MSKLQRLLSGALLVGVAVFLLGSGGPTITGAEARALVDQGALLLDVRTPGEFSAGHVSGAVNVPVSELEEKLATLPENKERPIVVYCQSGRRSAAAKKVLEKAGYTKVSDLGGMSNWR